MPTIKPFIDTGSEIDPANVPEGHVFVVAYHGGYVVGGEIVTGVPFVISYPLSHKTDKHFICSDGDKNRHIDFEQGFERYADACDKVISATKDEIKRLEGRIELLKCVLAHRETNKP